MIKYITLMILPLWLSSCSEPHDATFYSLHPKYLQEAIEQCPEQHPDGVTTCEELNEIATRANELISELHYNPQGFGQKILKLQEEGVTSDTQNNAVELAERLAIIKWLESPKG